MRFLVVASFPQSLITFRGALLEALVSSGLEVHVASPDLSRDKESSSRLKNMGVKTHNVSMSRTGLNPLADLRTIWSMWRLMRKLKPHYMLAYTIKPVLYGTLAAWLAKVPRRYILITGLGYTFQGDKKISGRGLLRALVQELYTFSARHVDLTFFQNPDDEALFRQLGILSSKQRSLIVNGSGISVDSFAVAPLPAEPSFLMIARLLGDKGVREYFEAAKCLKARHPNVVFRLVGWIDENPNSITHQELEAWMESGVIEYLGKLDDVRPAIRDCSVYILPSYREGTPRTVLEAMAMGRAVVTTDAPGCRETVNDQDNGFLVPVRSIAPLVAAMERFINEPELISQMGRRSREIAVDKYDVHKVNAVMLKEMGIR